ncbi:MAG: hypothetical protein WC794_00920 [Candidatus Doudnabacteria bacterium]|jgi:tRNA nucleotidyltransferase/poly(A) polymerase
MPCSTSEIGSDMKYLFKPKTNLEKFGIKVFSVLVENFSQTFFVGGMVRDLLLGKKIVDIDIATQAKPDEIVKLLRLANILVDEKFKNFGVIIARQGNFQVEITTLRKDLKSASRYTKVVFVNDPKLDSQRRDFTINSLYLSGVTGQILDFHEGIKDLTNKTLRFIGNPKNRITEDPLRILRGLRFSLILGFKIEKKSLSAINKYFNLLKIISKTKMDTELNKIPEKKLKLLLLNVLTAKKILDKQFK